MGLSGGAREDRTPDLSSAIAPKGAIQAQKSGFYPGFDPELGVSDPYLRSASDPRRSPRRLPRCSIDEERSMTEIDRLRAARDAARDAWEAALDASAAARTAHHAACYAYYAAVAAQEQETDQ